jgi:hypothetical protein
MRASPMVIATLGLCALTGCTDAPERLDGQASPAGITTPAASAVSSTTAPSTAAPSTAAPSTAAPVSSAPSLPVSPSRGGTSDPAPDATQATSIIRRTDWPNVSLRNMTFMDQGDLRFRDGRTDRCTMLPGGARPAYGDYLTEEPADSPATEDALVLVECDAGDPVQALVMVQIGYDQKSRHAGSFIQADDSTTVLSYRIDDHDIVTTVRTAAGRTENHRYRFAGGSHWERV